MRSKRFLRAEQAPLDWDVPGLLAGVDEAGRGPLAGPVVAAAVILDPDHIPRGLDDSKKLDAAERSASASARSKAGGGETGETEAEAG